MKPTDLTDCNRTRTSDFAKAGSSGSKASRLLRELYGDGQTRRLKYKAPTPRRGENSVSPKREHEIRLKEKRDAAAKRIQEARKRFRAPPPSLAAAKRRLRYEKEAQMNAQERKMLAWRRGATKAKRSKHSIRRSIAQDEQVRRPLPRMVPISRKKQIARFQESLVDNEPSMPGLPRMTGLAEDSPVDVEVLKEELDLIQEYEKLELEDKASEIGSRSTHSVSAVEADMERDIRQLRNAVVEEIDERHKFLRDMARVGESDPGLVQRIRAEINSRLKELEELEGLCKSN